jgi:hypothetical protein
VAGKSIASYQAVPAILLEKFFRTRIHLDQDAGFITHSDLGG